MTFSSIAFFVFFAIVCAVMAATNIRAFSNRRLRHCVLLAASYVFYGWWDWRFCFLMLALTIVAYLSALQSALQRDRDPDRKRRLPVIMGVAVPLVVLGLFKYYNFFATSFMAAFGIRDAGSLRIILPVGISFYTFQSLSYTIDVYRGKIAPEKDFVRLALYIAFFPQLVAGPIVRASDFLPQLDEDRNIGAGNFRTGIQIFMFGLFKKIVFADHLSVFVDDVFRKPNAFHAISLVLGGIAYAIQIYFDFSGYSDMAIGCAKCLGYDFARNFNVPYISRNLSEFWRRWHISLSSWLREYLYIPLGGNRNGAARTYSNLMITMLLGGLWHGADWTFVVWGGLHGAALCAHRLYRKRFPEREPDRRKRASAGFLSAAHLLLTVLLTNIFVAFCWIFFRAGSFAVAKDIIVRIVTWRDGIVQIYAWCVAAMIVLLAATVVATVKARVRSSEEINGFYPILDLSKFWQLTLFFIEAGLIIGLAFTGANPFIYFQF